VTSQNPQPADLAARLAALRDQITDAAHADADGDGVQSPEGGWRTVGRDEAMRELTARGIAPQTAQALVSNYLDQTSRQVGAAAHAWGLDQADLDVIAREHQQAEQARPTPGTPAAREAAASGGLAELAFLAQVRGEQPGPEHDQAIAHQSSAIYDSAGRDEGVGWGEGTADGDGWADDGEGCLR
jgi:hypothetical protein